jgi:putative phosphoribosyl transferase
MQVEVGPVKLEGFLDVSEEARGLVIFVHGSGSSRHSPRNQAVARMMREGDELGTLLFDLLTEEEGRVDEMTAELRFDIPMLAERVVGTIAWARDNFPDLRLGLIGSSTGAAAALVAAAKAPVEAVVSRGGRPDLAGDALPLVRAPTMLIVGSEDFTVLELNRQAYDRMVCEKQLIVVPGATHLFPEAGTLEAASQSARHWFHDHLAS